MTTALITHEDCFDHVTPPGHPEQVARLDAVLGALEGYNLIRVKAPLAAEDDLLRAHPKAHVDAIRAAAPSDGWRSLDADTHMSVGTLQAAYRAAGGVVRAVDMVMAGEVANAFAAVRPPGHHAERETAMGFCFFGNVAIGAKHALDHHGLDRVLILMCITATGRKIWSRMMRASCSVRPISPRFTPARVRPMKPVSAMC